MKTKLKRYKEPKRVCFDPTYAGPWEGEIFAIRHYRRGWLSYFSRGVICFVENSGASPKFFTDKSNVEAAAYALASEMDEPFDRFRVVSLLVMDEQTWCDSADGG